MGLSLLLPYQRLVTKYANCSSIESDSKIENGSPKICMKKVDGQIICLSNVFLR